MTITVKRLLFSTALLILGGCLSVPFSTLGTLSQLDGKNFKEISAKDIRVKLTINSDIDFDITKTRLHLGVKNRISGYETDLFLQQKNTAYIPLRTGLFSNTPAMTSYIFALNSTSQNEFNKLKQTWQDKLDNELTITVTTSLPDSIKSMQTPVYLSTAVKWDKNDKYILLIDEMKLNLL